MRRIEPVLCRTAGDRERRRAKRPGENSYLEFAVTHGKIQIRTNKTKQSQAILFGFAWLDLLGIVCPGGRSWSRASVGLRLRQEAVGEGRGAIRDASSEPGFRNSMRKQSRVLSDRRKDHPISPATIRKMVEGRGLSCQHALFLLRWLGVPPEAFIPAPQPRTGGVPLPRRRASTAPEPAQALRHAQRRPR